MRKLRALGAMLAAVAALAVAAGGCGSSGGATATTSGGGSATEAARTGGELTKIKVGILPIASMAPIYVGIEKGYFRDAGLEVEPVVAQGGAAIIPAVLSGDLQIGYGNNVSLMLAKAKGLPVRIIAKGGQAGSNAHDSTNALLVAADSDIKSVDDLAGKTFAVSTLDNLAEVTIKAALEKHGVDISNLKFTEVGFPEMNAAVQKGAADAAWTTEPFITLGEQQGMRNVIDPMIATTPHLSLATYFSSQDYIDSHPEVIAGFVRALDRSVTYARSHLNEVRMLIHKRFKTPIKLLEQMPPPNWGSELNVKSIKLTYRLARKYGVLKQPFDINELLPENAS